MLQTNILFASAKLLRRPSISALVNVEMFENSGGRIHLACLYRRSSLLLRRCSASRTGWLPVAGCGSGTQTTMSFKARHDQPWWCCLPDEYCVTGCLFQTTCDAVDTAGVRRAAVKMPVECQLLGSLFVGYLIWIPGRPNDVIAI